MAKKLSRHCPFITYLHDDKNAEFTYFGMQYSVSGCLMMSGYTGTFVMDGLYIIIMYSRYEYNSVNNIYKFR